MTARDFVRVSILQTDTPIFTCIDEQHQFNDHRVRVPKANADFSIAFAGIFHSHAY